MAAHPRHGSSFGFGEALVAVPLLSLLMPVEVAAPLAVLISITVGAIIVVQDHQKIHVGSAVRLVVSTLFGIPLGLLVLTSIPEAVIKGGLAVIIISFSAYALFSRHHLETGSLGFSVSQPASSAAPTA